MNVAISAIAKDRARRYGDDGASRRLLGTTELNLREFGWALVPAIALLALWELGKLVARRSAAARRQPEPSGVLSAEVPTQRPPGR